MLDGLSFEHDNLAKLLWTAGLVGLIFFFGSTVASSNTFWILDTQIKDGFVDYKYNQSAILEKESKGLVSDELGSKKTKIENQIIDLKRQKAEVLAINNLYRIGSYISLVAFLAGLLWWYTGPYKQIKKDKVLTTQLLELDIEIKKKEIEIKKKELELLNRS